MSDVKGTTLYSIRPFKPGERRENPDGTYSTELLRSVIMPDGSFANVPSLYMAPGGPIQMPDSMSDDQLAGIAKRLEDAGVASFPRFKSMDDAINSAIARSRSGGVK